MKLASSALLGVKWSSASQFSRQGLQVITTVILARLLAPTDFGLMGMAMVVVGFLNVFRDLGVSAAIVQREHITDTLLASVFWVNVAFGTAVTVGMYLSSPIVAAFYGEARVAPVLRVLSISFLISSFGTLQQAMLERNLEFSKTAKTEVFAASFGAAIGIAMAFKGAGVWSLVGQTVSAIALSTTLLWLVYGRWRPRLIFDRNDVKSVASFSLHLSGFNFFNYFARNADSLLIGKFLGAQSLGYYSLAYRLMLYPLQNITGVVSRVMFPIYSRIRNDDKKLRQVYLQVAGAIAVVTFPLMLGMMAVNKYFVDTFFGSQWGTVSALLLFLSPVGLMQSIDATTGSVYQAKGRTDLMFRWGLFSGTLAVIAFLIGLQWGVLGVVSSYLVASAVWTYPGLAIPLRLIHMKVSDLLLGLWRPLLCALLMAVAVAVVRTVLPEQIPKGAALGVLVLSGMGIYSLASLFFNRAILNDILELLRHSRGQEPAGRSSHNDPG